MTVTLNATNDVRNYLSAKYTYGAVGSDNTVPTELQSTLGAEIVRVIEASSDTSVDKRFKKEFLFSSLQGNGSIFSEIGLFDAASSGNMLSRNLVADLAKNDLIEVIYEITFEVVNV